MHILYTLLVILFSLSHTASADGGHAHGPDGSHISGAFDSGHSGDTIVLSEDSIRNIDIQTEEVATQEIAPQLSLYGRITTDPRRISRIGAQFDGKLSKVYVLIGDEVSKGEELLATTPIQIGTKSTKISSPTAGFITEIFASQGAVFQTGDPLIEVSNLSRVIFEGDFFDSTHIANLNSKQACSVTTKRYRTRVFPCSIETIDAQLKGTPPVGHVHAVIENLDNVLQPGMTGQIHIAVGDEKPRLTIHHDAVLGHFEKQFVYVREGNSFLRRDITTGNSFGEYIEVLQGLKVGEMVVTQGHYQLQFATSTGSLKEDASKQDSHAHEHHSSEKHDHTHDHSTHAHSH